MRSDSSDGFSGSMEEWIEVGTVFRKHGIRGEVKVYPLTDSPRRFLDLEEVVLEDPAGKRQKVRIDRVRFQKDRLILHFAGLDTLDEIEPFLKSRILIHRSQALPLGEGRYYHADIIGLAVVSEEGLDLGSVTEILETGSNDVYVVRKGKKEILIPAIAEVVRKVDLARGEMIIHVMEGLFEPI
ncbi:MAG: 16S rRNA processing protein RimM [Deltaproteobacteria bacterium]|nr:16S rRNA processing protein RimM [Deltaproteobacteria bacterium]